MVSRARDVVFWGSSSTAGNGGGGTTIATELSANTTGPGAITNKGLGGQTGAQTRTAVLAGTVGELASDTIFQFGGNGFNNAGDAELTYQYFLDSKNALGHDRWMFWISHNANTETYGSLTWQRSRKLAEYVHDAFPGQSVDQALDIREYPGNVQTDDTTPPGIMADASHKNATGYIWVASRESTPFIEALNGYLKFLPPVMRLYTNASTAHNNGGVVVQVPSVGTASGITFSFATPQTDFAISSSGLITRATSTPLTEDYYSLPIKVSDGTHERTTTVLLSVGSAATAPSRVTLPGNVWMGNDVPLAGSTNTSKAVTIALDLEFYDSGTDAGTHNILLTAAGLGISIVRLSSGTIRIFVRDAANTGVSVASLTSSQLLRAANGRRWVFFTIDTVTQVAALVVDDTTAVTSTPTANLSLNIAGASTSDVRLFTSTTVGASIAKCHVGTIWVAEGYIDIRVQDNRDLFRNAATKVGLDLGASGTVSGLTPFLYMRGSAADYYRGKNQGTGGRVVTADKGRITTHTLATQPVTASNNSGKNALVGCGL